MRNIMKAKNKKWKKNNLKENDEELSLKKKINSECDDEGPLWKINATILRGTIDACEREWENYALWRA